MSDRFARKPLLPTFLTCVLIGPPVGALVMGLSFRDEEGVVTAIASGLLMVPFSYISGGLSALVSGLAMVAFGRFNGQPPLWFAIACAVATFAVLQSVQNDQALGAAVLLLAAHVVSAVVCWIVFSRFWKKSELAVGTHPSPSLAGRGKDAGKSSFAGRGKTSP
jgi:uncharacterized membrane protein